MSVVEARDAVQGAMPPTFPTGGDVESQRKERRDAAEHRQRILAAARELFATQGVDGTSMVEIARAAEVGQGTLYRRYANKGELCFALLGDNVRRLREEVETHIAAAGGEASALAQLEFLILRLADFNEENAPLLGAMGDAACGERRHAAYHSPLYTWLRGMAVTLLGRAAAQGETAPLDVEATAAFVLAPLAIDLYLYQRDELGYTPERIVAALRRLIFDGLRLRPDPTGQ